MNSYAKTLLSKLSLFSLCRVFWYNFSTYIDIYNNVNGNHLITLYSLKTFLRDKGQSSNNVTTIFMRKN